jgi:sugar lactone lactonase YvrE
MNSATKQLTVLADESTSLLFAVPPEVFGVVEGPGGAVYFCDVSNHRIFRIDPTSEAITAVVGSGERGNAGDGGPATAALVTQPYELRFDQAGNLFFVDMQSQVVRRVGHETRLIATVAGDGSEGFGGDEGAATSAQLAKPHSIELSGDTLYIADIANHRVRAVDLPTGVIRTFAGTGEQAALTSGAKLIDIPVNGPRAIAFESDGSMVLGLREGNAIYRIDMATEEIEHVAGNGEFGYAGDGGDATDAQLAGPKGIALTPDGAIVIADTESHTVRVIGADGTIETLAGNGEAGTSLDPQSACLNRPHGVFVDSAGAILIGDSDNRRLLRLSF